VEGRFGQGFGQYMPGDGSVERGGGEGGDNPSEGEGIGGEGCWGWVRVRGGDGGRGIEGMGGELLLWDLVDY